MKLHISKKLPLILAGVILALLLTILIGAKAVQAKETKSRTQTVQTVAGNTLSDAETNTVGADGQTQAEVEAAVAVEEAEEAGSTGSKALAAAIAVGLAAAAGAIGMGLAIAKSAEGTSRQPEAEGSIRTTLMLGLVFIETAIIYALIVAILIIFVM